MKVLSQIFDNLIFRLLEKLREYFQFTPFGYFFRVAKPNHIITWKRSDRRSIKLFPSEVHWRKQALSANASLDCHI